MIALNKNYPIKATCKYCNTEYCILLDVNDLINWITGHGYIHEIMSYLSPEERELIISGTCNNCWNEFFGYIDDETKKILKKYDHK